ncbi:MAG: site-2 protease family protein, partial [Synechococcales cyanobacterium]
MVIGLFSSVLIHELGHSLVARSFGIKVSSITLFLFGGVAAIEQEPKTPGQTFQIAIAGPTVSLLIAGVLILMNRFNSHRIIGDVGDTLGGINLTLGLFNLIPGLPLDGGQMLKAIVWKLTGDRFKGIYWAATLGLLLGWFAIILGVWTALLGGFQGLWMTLLGWFVVQNASTTKRFAHIQHALVAIKAGDAMGREFR